MKPIGLSIKNIVNNIFSNKTTGEAMVIHQCLLCKKISLNRIAGDDNMDLIVSLLNYEIDSETITILNKKGIILLDKRDKYLVQTALYGCI